MDDMLLPVNLFEYVAQEVRKRRAKAKSGAADKKGAVQPSFTPLSEADGLYFRLSPTATPLPPARVTAVTDAFRLAFQSVWAGIPDDDRRRLRDYWRTQKRLPSYDEPWPPPPHRPLIQITDDEPWSHEYQVCRHFGAELNFPVSLVLEHSDRITSVIGRTLAQVFRLATRQHWGLYLELVEEPLARWEQHLGRKVTDAARDRKLDELEAEYFPVYESEMAELLRRWGRETTSR